jgi:hypothetical protein
MLSERSSSVLGVILGNIPLLIALIGVDDSLRSRCGIKHLSCYIWYLRRNTADNMIIVYLATRDVIVITIRPPNEHAKWPLWWFVFWVEFVECLQTLLRIDRVESKLVQIHNIDFIWGENSVNFSTIRPWTWINTEQTLDWHTQILCVNIPYRVDCTSQIILIDAEIAILIIQFRTVSQWSSFEKCHPNTECLCHIAIYVRRILALLEELLHTFFRR